MTANLNPRYTIVTIDPESELLEVLCELDRFEIAVKIRNALAKDLGRDVGIIDNNCNEDN